jgi:hypothetical protein
MISSPELPNAEPIEYEEMMRIPVKPTFSLLPKPTLEVVEMKTNSAPAPKAEAKAEKPKDDGHFVAPSYSRR